MPRRNTLRPYVINDVTTRLHARASCRFQILLQLYDRIQCARETRDATQKNATLLERCRCYPPCSEVFYDISYSLSKWPAGGYEGDAAYFDVFHVERFRDRFLGTPKYNIVSEYFTDKTREQGMKDFARLNVYIADSSVVITTETPDYLSTQLVSDIGGQLGLWVGISVITLAEVFQLAFSLIRYFLSAERRQLRFAAGDGDTAAGSDVTQKKESKAGLESADESERRQFLEKFDAERYQNSSETPGKLDESRYGQVYAQWDVNR